jgi:hypothetical protein
MIVRTGSLGGRLGSHPQALNPKASRLSQGQKSRDCPPPKPPPVDLRPGPNVRSTQLHSWGGKSSEVKVLTLPGSRVGAEDLGMVLPSGASQGPEPAVDERGLAY